jgi:L,D-transpeptidase ErfK/SrfK
MRQHASLALAFLVAACSTARPPEPPPALPPLVKLTAFEVEVPGPKQVPPVVGHMQAYRVRKGDTLLDIARDAGLGYQELQDANPGVDQWVPAPEAEVSVPTRWIVPRSQYRGLVVNVPEMRLYMFPRRAKPGERVTLRTWAVSIGLADQQSPLGRFTVRDKDKNPTWFVPDSIYKEMDEPRRVVPPGPDNPLGDYRLRLSEGSYSIHGTNTPWSIGRETTHGCVRLYPEDLEVLYPMVPVGMPVEFVYEPVKLGQRGGDVYVEVHSDRYKRVPDLEKYAVALVQKAGLASRVEPARLRQAVQEKRGVPVLISRGGETSYGI